MCRKADRDDEIVKWLDKVGIVDSRKRLHAYPHELSGGMQQRVMIAMALCTQPKLLIADEPTTALDVTIQKQIMDLLAELRRDLDMSIILITHNLGIIRSVVDRVAVMFRGEIVETGPVDEILRNPQHAYTKALLACVPRMGAKQPRLTRPSTTSRWTERLVCHHRHARSPLSSPRNADTRKLASAKTTFIWREVHAGTPPRSILLRAFERTRQRKI
jgi:ABC-type dipeptide/oligopeptide/nickel transport system ATPase component